MKFKKQITAVILLVCILLTPVLTSSASAHAYDHVYTDVTVITPDSLEDVFGEAEVDRAAYTYEMVELNNSRAVVALEMELKIGHDYYTAVVSGTINAYSLPSGSKLYEGPLRGNIIINGENCNIIASFLRYGDADGASVSVTIQNEVDIVVVAFGEKITEKEVLDFYFQSIEDSQTLNDNPDMDNLDEAFNSLENTYSTFNFGPAITPVPHPGGGDIPSYPDIGNYKFKYVNFDYFSSTPYKSLETRIYVDNESNQVLVGIKPYSSNFDAYFENNIRDNNMLTFFPKLSAFEVVLTLDNPDSANYGEIEGLMCQDDAGYIHNIVDPDAPLTTLFLGLLDPLIPSNITYSILESMEGQIIEIGPYSYLRKGLRFEIATLPTENPNIIETLDIGVPYAFKLRRGSTAYTGNTKYTCSGSATYSYVAYEDNEGDNQDFIRTIYIWASTSYTGYIDLGDI